MSSTSSIPSTSSTLPTTCRASVAVALALSATLFLHNCWLLRDLQIDDAFITYRFGARLAHFHTLRWNLGAAFDPVEGYTSFLAVLISAVFELLRIEPLLAWKTVGILCVAGAAAAAVWGAAAVCRVWWPAGERYGVPLAMGVPVLVSPLGAIHAMSGMETALFSFLLLTLTALSIHLVTDETGERWKSRLLAAGFLALGLTRPEGVLWAAVTGTGVWWSLWHRPERRAAFVRAVVWLFVLPGAVYFAARWSYFGDFFPATFRAKAGSALHPSRLGRLATYLPSLREVWRYARDYWLCLGLVAVAAAAVRLLLAPRERATSFRVQASACAREEDPGNARLQPGSSSTSGVVAGELSRVLFFLFVASALCLGFFARVHLLMGFAQRFLFPFGQTFLLTLVVPAIATIFALIETGEKARGKRRARLLAAGIGLALAFGLCAARTVDFGMGEGLRAFSVAVNNNRTARRGYTDVARALEEIAARATSQRNPQLATRNSKLEIAARTGRQLALFHHNMGQLMYYAPHWDSIDPVGLVDRHVATNGFSADYVFGLRPEVFLLPSKRRDAITPYEAELAGDVSRSLYLDSRMRESYECLGYYPGLRFGLEGAIHFLVRRDFLERYPGSRDLLSRRLGLRVDSKFDAGKAE